MNSGSIVGGPQTSGASTQSYLLLQQQQGPEGVYANPAIYGRTSVQAVGGNRVGGMYRAIQVNNAGGGGMSGGSGGSASSDNRAGIIGGAGTNGATNAVNAENEALYQLMIELFSATNREQALAELSRRRDQNPELGVALWNSFGVMTILYQEIISIYPLLNPPALTMVVSNRVCNSLALLQLVATHEQTRMQLLKANVPQLLYPFLSTASKVKQYDNLRLTSLGVIGALVKYDNHEVISFFVATEFLPLCLKIMDIGSELCKVVATFIFQKIIIDDGGFHYVTSHPKRLRTVLIILNNVVNQMVGNPSGRLLKSVTKCLIRLADNSAACEYLKTNLSEFLRNSTFAQILAEDASYRHLIFQLMEKLA